MNLAEPLNSMPDANENPDWTFFNWLELLTLWKKSAIDTFCMHICEWAVDFQNLHPFLDIKLKFVCCAISCWFYGKFTIESRLLVSCVCQQRFFFWWYMAKSRRLWNVVVVFSQLFFDFDYHKVQFWIWDLERLRIMWKLWLRSSLKSSILISIQKNDIKTSWILSDAILVFVQVDMMDLIAGLLALSLNP